MCRPPLRPSVLGKVLKDQAGISAAEPVGIAHHPGQRSVTGGGDDVHVRRIGVEMFDDVGASFGSP